MGRSSADLSATETLRTEPDRGEDRRTLRRLHEQARAHIETGAGPDRRPELRRLQRLHANLPMMRDILAVNERDVARLDSAIARTRHGLADAHQQLEALTRPRRFRRPDQPAIDDARHRIGAQQRYLDCLLKERAHSAAQFERSRHRLRDTENAVVRIPDVEVAITRRSDWLASHPAELAWEADLVIRLNSRSDEQPGPRHERVLPDHDVEPHHLDIDLKPLDLSRRLPRTGIERASCGRPSGSGTPGNPKLGSHPLPVEASRALTSAAEHQAPGTAAPVGSQRAKAMRTFFT